jgi:Family of unknown function (DUF5989)
MDRSPSQFEKEARPDSFLGDLLHFVRATGKWWLVPVLIIILLFGLLVLFSGSAIAPFIYTLF